MSKDLGLAGPDQSQEPGAPSTSPLWVGGTQALGPSLAALQGGHLREASPPQLSLAHHAPTPSPTAPVEVPPLCKMLALFCFVHSLCFPEVIHGRFIYMFERQSHTLQSGGRDPGLCAAMYLTFSALERNHPVLSPLPACPRFPPVTSLRTWCPLSECSQTWESHPSVTVDLPGVGCGISRKMPPPPAPPSAPPQHVPGTDFACGSQKAPEP